MRRFHGTSESGFLRRTVPSLGKGEHMNIGVIGPGDIGEVIVRKLRDADYPVKMASRKVCGLRGSLCGPWSKSSTLFSRMLRRPRNVTLVPEIALLRHALM